jgi:hypothetical protein
MNPEEFCSITRSQLELEQQTTLAIAIITNDWNDWHPEECHCTICNFRAAQKEK